jgi:hypothetical protein
MSIEQIPADELVTMTELWHRAFNAAGCNPMCHCCHKWISVDVEFKLATVQQIPTKEFSKQDGWAFNPVRIEDESGDITTREVMLCDTCTPKMFLEKQKEELQKNLELGKDRLAKRIEEGGCFRINGKIIH